MCVSADWLCVVCIIVCTDWCVCVHGHERRRALWLSLCSVCCMVCVSADRLCACYVYNWCCGHVHTRGRRELYGMCEC